MSDKWSLREDEQQEVGEAREQPRRNPLVKRRMGGVFWGKERKRYSGVGRGEVIWGWGEGELF